MNKRQVSRLIFDNVESIEQAIDHIERNMLPELHAAVAYTVHKFCEYNKISSNIGETFDDKLGFYDSSWLMDNGKKFNLYIDLNSIEGEGGIEPESWLGNFYGYAGSGFCLKVLSDSLSYSVFKNFVNSKENFIKKICTSGFKLNREDGSLYYPVRFEKNVISEAFLTGDFNEAMVPLSDALEAVYRVWGELDRMCGAIKTR